MSFVSWLQIKIVFEIHLLVSDHQPADPLNIYMAGCTGVEQLGGPDPWYNTKVGASKSLIFT